MNKLTTSILLITITFLLSNCGGENSSSAIQDSPVENRLTSSTPETQANSYELIIDNGRGTYNNQDNEKTYY